MKNRKSVEQIWYECWREHMAAKGVNLPKWEDRKKR
jgi:hypothetical protein